MTANATARARVLELLADIRPEADYESATNFLTEGLLDSFDVVTLVDDLEHAFDIRIDGLDIVPEHFANLDALMALLGKNGVEA